MTDFYSVVASQAEIGIRFFLKIQGIPSIFLDGAVPTTKNGGSWSAPTSGGFSYTLREHALDVSGGISDPGSLISRSSGDSQPGQMTITLREDRSGYLHTLMAREKSNGKYANLTASFGYADASPPSTMTVDDTTGWDSSGFLYFGRETIRYGGKTSTTFTTLTRDLFSVGDCDTVYRHEDNLPSVPRVVSDFPRVWHGRYVQLFAFVVGADGTAFDSGFSGAYEVEIWRGVIRGNPRPLQDWQRYEIQCDSIESILDSQVGREAIKGSLLRVPGAASLNNWGKVVQPNVSNPAMSTWAYWLDSSTRYVSIRIKEWADQTAYDNQDPPTVYDYTGADRIDLLDGGSSTRATRSGVKLAWAEFVTQVVATDTASLSLTIDYVGNWYVYGVRGGTASEVYEVEIQWDAQGSIGDLLGFEGTSKMFVNEHSAVSNATIEQLAAYVSLTATTVPFWFQDEAGDKPAAPGYARLGDEIISFESIVDLGASDAAISGIYELQQVRRGLCNTSASVHEVKLDENWEAASDQVELVFGVGFEGANFVDAILQFATSTGSGHHGDYDVFGDKISVPLCPNHFDVAAMEAIGAGLVPDQVTVSWFASKPFQLRELISDWLRPHGLYLTSRPNADGDFLITIDKLLPALESEANTSVGTSHLDITDPASYVDGLDRVINEVEVRPRWDVIEEDSTDDVVTILDHDSISEFGERTKIEWKLRGYAFGEGKATAVATQWAYGLFARYARPYDLFELRMSRAGLILKPGDVLSLTVPSAPSSTGVRGITNRQAVVLRVAKRWHPTPGESTGADVTVVLEPQVRASTYAPSARVASYSAGTPSVTLHASTYSGSDVAHFEVDDVVRIYNEGDVSSIDERTIVGIAGNVVTISSALSNCTPSSTETIMVPADHDDGQAEQRKHAHIGDNATPSTLGAGADEAFNWI